MSEIVQNLLEIMESPVYVQGYLTVYIQQLSIKKFSQNKIQSNGVSGLADALYQIANFQNLTLFIDGKNNQINEIGAYGLGIGLANNIALTSLKLSLFQNAINEQTISGFSKGFAKTKNKLKVLNVNLKYHLLKFIKILHKITITQQQPDMRIGSVMLWNSNRKSFEFNRTIIII
ncbi:hypothetical protein ABPG72_022435 [Tetrahymena utriculariae]